MHPYIRSSQALLYRAGHALPQGYFLGSPERGEGPLSAIVGNNSARFQESERNRRVGMVARKGNAKGAVIENLAFIGVGPAFQKCINGRQIVDRWIVPFDGFVKRRLTIISFLLDIGTVRQEIPDAGQIVASRSIHERS